MSSELEEYLKQCYEMSVFDLAGPRSDQPTLLTLHLHEARILTGWIKENKRYDIIYQPSKRNFIKNKTLFPLMQQREVMFFTLLEGEIIRGLITGFTRYEIMVNMKGGVLVTILRHAVYAFRDKQQKSYLKRDIEKQTKK